MVFAGGALLAAAGPCGAQELRAGAGYAPHKPEQSASIVADYVFKSPKILKFAGAPRPYVGTQVSLEGDTNYAQAGLTWRWGRGKLYLDLGAGLAVHDGAISLLWRTDHLGEDTYTALRRMRHVPLSKRLDAIEREEEKDALAKKEQEREELYERIGGPMYHMLHRYGFAHGDRHTNAPLRNPTARRARS